MDVSSVINVAIVSSWQLKASKGNICYVFLSSRGYCTPNLKHVFFYYLNIVNTFFKNNVLFNNSRTTWPTHMSMLFLSSMDYLLLDAYIIFQKDVDDFEVEYKTG